MIELLERGGRWYVAKRASRGGELTAVVLIGVAVVLAVLGFMLNVRGSTVLAVLAWMGAALVGLPGLIVYGAAGRDKPIAVKAVTSRSSIPTGELLEVLGADGQRREVVTTPAVADRITAALAV